jgi:hypothetical protein
MHLAPPENGRFNCRMMTERIQVNGPSNRKVHSRGLLIAALGLGCLTFASSCGKSKIEIKGQLPVFPVSGQLTMDGQPMADAQLVFYSAEERPKGTSRIRPHATTNEDGTFRVSTYGSEDGAPVGQYRVTVSWKGPSIGPSGEVGVAGDDDDRPEKVPAAFRNPKFSRIKVEIAEGENALTAWDLANFGQPGQQQTANTSN